MKYAWWRRILIILPLAAGAGVFYLVASNKEAPKQAEPIEPAVLTRVITAEELDIAPKVQGFGTVGAARVWNAVARVAGEIEYLNPDMKEGALLKANTELIRISPRDYELQIKQAKANIRLTEAKISELETSRDSLARSVEIELQALKLKENQLERMRELRERGTVSDASLEEEENTVLSQRQKIQDLANSTDVIPSQIEAQREQIAVYQSQLAVAELNLERVHIRLPFDARISSVDVEVTQYVQVGKEMGTADGIGSVEIAAQIPVGRFRQFMDVLTAERFAGAISDNTFADIAERSGLYAVVRLPFDHLEASWRGRVVRVDDGIDPETRTVGVVVEVDRPYEKVIPGQRPLLGKGMFVEVELISDALENVFAVPRTAIQNDKVFVVGPDNRLESRPIEISFAQGEIAVIGSGMESGDQVVTSDLVYASEGMLLDPVEDDALVAVLRREAQGAGADQ
ncbi:hypothetical protein ABVF61_31065 [Roseibium sp. HPY-6]|uniref:efflux RND transporter periplasmic adaptor subunit n=1 Tax=Roseibium sp. HPY-6 TaxID=3229852 RepID=UPI00338D3534